MSEHREWAGHGSTPLSSSPSSEPNSEEGQEWRVVELERDDGGWLVVGNGREKAWCWTRGTARQIVADHAAARDAEARIREQNRQLRWAWLNLGCRCIFDGNDVKIIEDGHCPVHGVYVTKDTWQEIDADTNSKA